MNRSSAIQTFEGLDAGGTPIRVTVRRDRDTDEWICEASLFLAAHDRWCRVEDIDYFTDDRRDALDTAKAMVAGPSVARDLYGV